MKVFSQTDFYYFYYMDNFSFLRSLELSTNITIITKVSKHKKYNQAASQQQSH